MRARDLRREPEGSGARRLPAAGRRCPVCGERYPEDFVVCPHDATPLGLRHEDGDPLLGAILAGTYRLTRLIAQGGMGRLYEAEHTRLPRRVAVKVVHEVFASNADVMARFDREARATASIDSDHVLAVLDVLRTPDGRPCLVSEHLEGEDLQARLSRTRTLPLPVAVGIARQMCRGLAAAHARGIVHRDLKPSNVFLASGADGRCTVKLLDFGVAKLIGAPEITRDGAVLGTPAYMAPEQATGASHVDGRADVYGVGAVLYRALTGASPHAGPDATASLSRLLGGPPTPARALAPELPQAVLSLLDRALARDPDGRYPDALALERALDALGPDDAESLSQPLHAAPGVSETTLVLPRGSVSGAAPRAAYGGLPTAALAAAAAALGAGLAAATCGPALSDALGLAAPGATSTLLAALASLATATLLFRALRRRVAEPARARRVASELGRALAQAALACGVVTLALSGADALAGLAMAPATQGAVPALTALFVLAARLARGLERA